MALVEKKHVLAMVGCTLALMFCFFLWKVVRGKSGVEKGDCGLSESPETTYEGSSNRITSLWYGGENVPGFTDSMAYVD